MSSNRFLERLRTGEIILGLANMYPAPSIIEGMCKGWDFVWIDAQHGQISYDTALVAVQVASGAGLATMLRVPGQENCVLGPFADLAPSAIMVPMVDTAQQAAAIVDGLCFPPKGKRSYGGRRVIDLYGRNYFLEHPLAVVAQIETLEAVDNVEAIIATDGIDVLFFGPDDMKARMGIPINTPPGENARLCQAMEYTAKVARSAGKFAGTVAGSVENAELVVKLGYQVIVGGSDIGFLRNSAADQLQKLRKTTGGKGISNPAGTSGVETYGR